MSKLGRLLWFLIRRYPFVVGCAVVLLATAALSSVFWGWLSGSESGSETVRNVALVAAGLIALLLALWRGLVSEQQASTAQQGLLNERYQKGADMLGSDVLATRLGGIYALQRLAEEHPELYHVQIMRLLCAFARRPTRDGEPDADRVDSPEIRQDVEAVVEIIRARSAAQVEIERQASFELDLRGASLSGARFRSANLQGAVFDRSILIRADFIEADLSRAGFAGADLTRAVLLDANLDGARLWNAHLYNASLQGANLSGAALYKADLSGAGLVEANLSGAILEGAVLVRAMCKGANLSGASLLGADLSASWLAETDMTHCTLLDANLSGAILDGADLTGAEFIGSTGLQGAGGLTKSQLDKARFDADQPPILSGVVDAENGRPLIVEDDT